MLQILTGFFLIFQLSIGIYRLQWGIGLFIFIFIVIPDYFPFYDNLFGLNFLKASILIAFASLIIHNYNRNLRIQIRNKKNYFYPILWFMLFLLPSYTIAENSIGFFRGSFNLVFNMFTKEFLPGIIILLSLKNKRDFDLYLKWLGFAVIIMGLFGIFEYFTDNNPFIEWIKKINSTIIIEYNEETRYFFTRRVQSTCWHPIAYGGILSMIFIFLFTAMLDNIKKGLQISNYLILFVVIAINILLTASRASWLASFIGITIIFATNFTIFFGKKKQFYLFLAFLLLPFISYYLYELIMYIIDPNIKGSSFEMRFDQFNTIINYIGQSLYIGFGDNSIALIFQKGSLIDALGFESIIFVYLINSGLFGLIALLILYVTSFRNMINHEKSYYNSFFIAIFTSHIIFVLISGELKTLRVFWLLYSMLYFVHHYKLKQKNLFEKLLKI